MIRMIATIPTILALVLASAVGTPGEIAQPVDWTVAAHEGSGGRVVFAPEAPLLAIAADPDHAFVFETAVTADEKGRYPLVVGLVTGDGHEERIYPIVVRKPGDAYRETRISHIDGSVQYHAVRAPTKVEAGKRYALFLSLHGAGVAGHNQANAYAAKDDAFVVAPTNRRRFGFDWQDWGRLDALETLDWILARYPIDPDRVLRLAMTPTDAIPESAFTIHLDGTRHEVAMMGEGTFVRRDGGWTATLTPEDDDPSRRNPTLSGPFKLAWRNRMVWVYGTGGDEEENAATIAKVRYDAGAWWYRGNGNVTIVSDREFTPERYAGRNVILYGNADTNSAFRHLRPGCPIDVRRGRVDAGKTTGVGDWGAYLVYPGAGDVMYGVVGATSARALRMIQPARYFMSGSAVPDWVIFDETVLRKGLAGVTAAGWFSDDWKSLR